MATAGCSVEKNTGASRFYHNLTSKYNIYFNGLESYRAGVAKVNKGVNDDYGTLLNVFEYSDQASDGLCTADMERAVQKASKLITLKSITARPVKRKNQPSRSDDFYNLKEYNRWVDDSYLLMGKARFYQKDYAQARATITFNNENSDDQDIITEGKIWLARIHTETGSYSEALRQLEESGNPGAMPSSLRTMYYTTKADILIRQKKISEAISPLGNAISSIRSRQQKARLTYLLAQIYGATGQSEKAIEAYTRVTRMRAPYEMEFNARIGMASVYAPSAGGSGKIMTDLLAMTRDNKNKEYLDQIYYAMGRLADQDGKTGEAIACYKKAAHTTGSSANGRGRAYLALADHYFDQPDYINSRAYYDSALLILDRQYPDYQMISSRSANLGELVSQLTIISTEDSLRRVAAMNETDRSRLIDGIIQKVIQDERAMAMEGRDEGMYNLGQYYENERRYRDNIEQEGQWYFYNQAALTFGRTEFKRRWGDRPLEDNWRRRNKRIIHSYEIRDEEAADINDSIPGNDNPRSQEYYLRNLPLTDSLIAVSEDKTANALFNAGRVYATSFNDNQKATASWNDLLTRFGGHYLVPRTLYQLYMLYHETEPSRAEAYRQNLLEHHPGSDYALIMTDPDYFRKKREAELLTDKLYEQAYESYLAGNYLQAGKLCDSIITVTPGHSLTPKARLLRALTFAAQGNEKTYREQLSSLIKDYPGTEEAGRAAGLMSALDSEKPELRIEEDRQIAAEIYSWEPKEPHLFVLLIENPAFNINQATFDVINFNIDNFPDRNLKAAGSLIDNKFIILTISIFPTSAEAMEYYKSLDILKVVRNTTPANSKSFIISRGNMEAFLKDKDPIRYMVFFKEKYIDGK